MSRYQYSPSRNQTRIIHDDGRVEVVDGQVGAPEDADIGAPPTDGSTFYRAEDHQAPEAMPQSKAAALGLAQGATGRFLDELGGAVDTAGDYLKGDLGGANPAVVDVLNRYRQHVNSNRVELGQAQRQHPKTMVGTEIAGSILGPMGRMRGVAGAAGAGAIYGAGDSVATDPLHLAEDTVKAGAVGGLVGQAAKQVAPYLGRKTEELAIKGLRKLQEPASTKRFLGQIGVGSTVGAGLGSLVGGPMGAAAGGVGAGIATTMLGKSISPIAGKAANAIGRHQAARQLAKPHAILTSDDPRFPLKDSRLAKEQVPQFQREELGRRLRGTRDKMDPHPPVSEVRGRYDDQVSKWDDFMLSPTKEEQSLMMPLHKERQVSAIQQIGEDFGQESVLFSGRGNNALVFTNGPDKGKAILGKGTEMLKGPEQYSSTMKGPDGIDRHFRHNLDFDAGPQNFDARKVMQRPYTPGDSAGGMVGAGVAVAGGAASDLSSETRAQMSVADKMMSSNSRHLMDKANAGKISKPTYNDAVVALRWIADNVKNPYYAKQAMQKVMEEPNMAKQIVGGLQAGMQQSGHQEQGVFGGRRF